MKHLYLSLAFLVLWAGVATAQTEDRWLILSDFSGLNLYLQDSKVPVGGAVAAENIQFAKVGTMSQLAGLQLRATLSTTGYNGGATDIPIRGFAGMKDFSATYERMVAAAGSFLWNTRTDAMSNRDQATAAGAGTWTMWTDSTRFEDSDDLGRAAEFWRPGWLVKTDTSGSSNIQWDTIDYISDNGTLFFTTAASAPGSDNPDSYSRRITPVLDSTKDVQFVPVEVDGSAMFVVLQAGSEPLLYGGAADDDWRYFGIADSGSVKQAAVNTPDTGVVYIVDNSKIGIYGNNELMTAKPGAGYWLHLPYNFTDTDSSHWGHIWQIDSNVVVNAGDTSEFRIYFTPTQDSTGAAAGGKPGGAWLDSLRGSRYNLISAPFRRTVYTQTATPSAVFENGGRTIRMATGTISAREFDHIPHALVVENDTILSTYADSVVLCYRGDCDTVRVSDLTDPGISIKIADGVTEQVLTRERGFGNALPIRTSFVDTAGTDSLIIWTSGHNAGAVLADFTSSDWFVDRLTIPYASHGIMYNERLYLAGDPTDPNFISYSEPLQIGAFPTQNAISVGGNGDKFAAFALIYDWLVIFQEQHTWVLKGDPALGGALELALPDEGCIAPNSIIADGNTVVYLSHKGWRIFDGNNAHDWGIQIKPAVQAQPRVSYSVSQAYKNKSSAAFDPITGNSWLCMPFGSDTLNSGSFLQNAVGGSFTYSDEVYGGLVKSLVFNDTTWLVFTHPDSAKFYTYGYTDSLTPTGIDGDSMLCRWRSGWMDMDAPQARKTWDVGFMSGRYANMRIAGSGGNKVIVKVYRDYDSTAFTADTANISTIVSSVYYEAQYNMTFEPPADGSEFQYLQVEILAYGFTLFEPSRLGIRYNTDVDGIPADNKVQLISP